MSFIQIWAESFRAMFANPMRTLLTMLGIIIGIASVVLMLAVGDGIKAFINKQLAALGSNLVIVQADSLGPDQRFVLATPRVMLVRLLCASMAPWGEVDLPLTWRADDVGGRSAGEVSVAHDVSTSRVVLITSGRDGITRAVVMTSSEWIRALARLRTSLGIDV